MGSETYLLLKSLLSPKLPSAFTFAEIAAKLKDHLKPRRLTVAERYKFHQRNQKEGEDVTTFEAELRRLASTCNFGDFLDEALRDQLVCGIKNCNTQRKLLSEERSFVQAMHIALADEAADTEAQQLHAYGNTGNTTVSVVADQRKGSASKFTSHKRTENKIMQTNRKCYCCNGNHAPQDCKTGHIMTACRRKVSTCNETHIVEAAAVEQEEYSLYSLNNDESSYKQSITVRVKMNGKDVAMVVDTGAGVSIINERTMCALWPDNPPVLQPADHMKLTSYIGQTISVLGQLNVVTEYKGQLAQVPTVVVSGESRNLLTKLKLDWGEIMHVRNLHPDHSQLMAEVPDVFSEGLGELKGMYSTTFLAPNNELFSPLFRTHPHSHLTDRQGLV